MTGNPCHAWPTGNLAGQAQRDAMLAEQRAAAERRSAANALHPRPRVQPHRPGGPGTRRPETVDERLQAHAGRAAQAWRDVREKVQGWPADLAARELGAVRETYGPEPGARPAAEVVRERVEAQRPPAEDVDLEHVDPTTRALMQQWTGQRRAAAGHATTEED